MGDNGEMFEEKTQEQLKKEKFESSPEKFVDIDELIIAVKRSDAGIETFINHVSREDIEVSLIRLTHQCYGVFNAMSYAKQQKEQQGKIINPSGGILNFARRKR